MRTQDIQSATESRGRRPARFLLHAALLVGSVLASSCTGVRTLADPTLEVRTASGTELGVSTDHGVVFLGRTARSGPAQVTAWFADGPSIEATVIEPIGGGLYTAETEIRLPEVPLDFDTPRNGEDLVVVGRRGAELWEEIVQVRADPRVEGLLLSIPERLHNAPDQVGAGVFRVEEEGGKRLLVALVSGRVRLVGADGSTREYLTAIGPEQLWRLPAHRREFLRKRRWVYREDIL